MKKTPPPERLSREEREYFQAVEAHFIGLRGKPLLLSPLELQRAAEWFREGIPLPVVCRGIDRYFEERFETPVARERAVTLKYCEPYVHRAHEESRELAVGDGDDGPGRPEGKGEVIRALERILERTSASLESHGDPNDELSDMLGRIAEAVGRLREQALTGGPDVKSVESSLSSLDGEVVSILRRRAGEEQVARIRAECQSEIDSMSDTMDGELLHSTIERMTLRRLRELERVPEISLFAL